MIRRPPEPVQSVKRRRDRALAALIEGVPYISFLGIAFDRRGDELTAVLPFAERLIGNPALPAIHGGATAAFLETAAIIELSWSTMWEGMESGAAGPSGPAGPAGPDDAPDRDAVRAARPRVGVARLPKTIDFTVDYLRPGLPRDAYARARVNRSGRRYASVHVEAWQDNRARLFAQATGHFLMPPAADDD